MTLDFEVTERPVKVRLSPSGPVLYGEFNGVYGNAEHLTVFKLLLIKFSKKCKNVFFAPTLRILVVDFSIIFYGVI